MKPTNLTFEESGTDEEFTLSVRYRTRRIEDEYSTVTVQDHHNCVVIPYDSLSWLIEALTAIHTAT